MTEQDLQIQTPDGTADAVLFIPDANKRLSGILHIPDIASIRESQRSMARRLASDGYVVLMPNPFYRTGRPPVFTVERKDPRWVERMKELIAPVTPEAQDKDMAAYIDFLSSQPTVQSDELGVVGYCIGGGFALRSAALRPEKVRAMASFHGGGLYKADDPTSPHLL